MEIRAGGCIRQRGLQMDFTWKEITVLKWGTLVVVGNAYAMVIVFVIYPIVVSFFVLVLSILVPSRDLVLV